MAMPLSRDALDRFRAHIYNEFGIHHSAGKTDILRMKLEKLALARGIDLHSFLADLESGDPFARDALLDEITVGHTFFFREREHLDFLVADARSRGISNPTVWCAASSTGEEAYSIAIALKEAGFANFLIVASDVNPRALEAVNRGIYAEAKLQFMPRSLVPRYFTRLDETAMRVRRDLRPYLRIKRLNLRVPVRFERDFDYVFCRNVMIYFGEDSRRRVLENLSANLAKDGVLFVGHTEALLEVPSILTKAGPAAFRRHSGGR